MSPMAEVTTTTTYDEIRYDEWLDLAAEEYRLLTDLLSTFAPQDWRRPTDCSEWDVHAMVAHLVGGALSAGSPRETVRQLLVGRRLRDHGMVVDKINAAQVHERTDVPPERLVEHLARVGRESVASRRRIPAWIRAVRVPFGPPLGHQPAGYLLGRIYTRDEWMHRIDLSRAVGRELVLTPEHDGRIVADVVQEWARIHGEAFELRLTGPAGGVFRSGSGGPELELDAVEFARLTAGRVEGEGLLATQVPF